MLTFKDFSQQLNESPDTVYKGRTRLVWVSQDSRTFGTMFALPGVRPFFMMSTEGGVSHSDMLEEFINALTEAAINVLEHEGLSFEDEVRTEFERARRWFEIPAQDLDEVIADIGSNEKLWNMLKSEKLKDYFEDIMYKAGGGRGFRAELKYGARTKLFKNAGRIWLKAKVVSFWLTETQATQSVIDNVFDKFGIPESKRDSYLIDAVDVKHIGDEESPDKKLPSYLEYKSRSTRPQQGTKAEQKAAAELMAKQHGVAGAQKAKFEVGKLPEIGARKYAQQLPLHLRQQAQTSEARVKNKDSQLMWEAYTKKK